MTTPRDDCPRAAISVCSIDDATLAAAIVWVSMLAGVWIIGSLLVYGAEFAIPIAVAIFLWQLINGIARLFGRISIGGWHPGELLCLLAAVVTIVLACWFLVNIVATNVAKVSEAAPGYEQNLRNMFHRVVGSDGLAHLPSIEQITDKIDIASAITRLSGTLGGLVGNTGLVALYVMFLLAEQASFDRKLEKLFRDDEQRSRIRGMLIEIEYRIERYLWIKTLVSILTAALCYAVLVVVGVDYSIFWALVIFLFNYIPNIGSLFAVALPSILTVMQFGSVAMGAGVLLALTGIQFIVGNLVEPKMMGNSLNLSPLVIILSLTLWGSIWGIAGMFLCVPITVSLTIVLSFFELTRPAAILMSSDGNIGR
ncbi:MAG: AI-2E family transporter [Geminicoccaceae bacterium]|nr:AI-2E family transporter [Geminicoccaceae bacterium]